MRYSVVFLLLTSATGCSILNPSQPNQSGTPTAVNAGWETWDTPPSSTNRSQPSRFQTLKDAAFDAIAGPILLTYLLLGGNELL